MNIKNMIEALQICAKYVDEVESAYCSADHDIIYFPLEKNDPSPEDAARLKELGAFVEYDCWATHV
jgi:hypothetical protein